MNGYSIITPDQRAEHLATQGPKILLTGQFGVGKTYTIRTIPQNMKTIVLDIESGLMTVNQWMRSKEGSHIQTIRIETYEDFEDITVLACGPDKSASPDSPMSQAHHDHVMQKRKQAGYDVESEKKMFMEADVFFIDSISDLTKLAFAKAKREETTNNLMRVYGNMGQWVLGALRHWQHNHAKTVIFSCKLSQEEDEMGRKSWVIETEGRKIKNELPGIVDEVITLADIPKTGDNGVVIGNVKAFVCTSPNPQGYLAKDRSGQLEGYEQPHWGNLFAKMRGNGAEQPKKAPTPVAPQPKGSNT